MAYAITTLTYLTEQFMQPRLHSLRYYCVLF